MVREANNGLETFMVVRHHEIDFASGALVFPGGKPSAGDEALEWANHCEGWSTFDDTQRTLRIAAIREAYREHLKADAEVGSMQHLGKELEERIHLCLLLKV